MELVARSTSAFALDELELSPRHPVSSFGGSDGDGTLLAWATSSAGVQCWLASSGPTAGLTALACSTDSSSDDNNSSSEGTLCALAEVRGLALCGYTDGRLALFDYHDSALRCRVAASVAPPTDAVASVALLPAADRAVCAAGAAAVLIDDRLQTLARVQAAARRALLMTRGRDPATAALLSARHLQLWDTRLPSLSLRVPLAAPASCLGALTDPYSAVTGHRNGSVLLWDLRKPSAPLQQLQLHDGPVLRLLTCRGQLLSCGADGAVLRCSDASHVLPQQRMAAIAAAYEPGLNMLVASYASGQVLMKRNLRME